MSSSWLVSDWHRNAQECLSLSTTSQIDKTTINRSFSRHSLWVTAPSFSSVSAKLRSVHGAPLPAAFGFPPLWTSATWGPLLQTLWHSSGRAEGVLAICCPAQITLSLGAVGYMVEGLEKIVHNLWSMWIIFLWHIKNSWQREKCWVKDNNLLLSFPWFDCCKKSGRKSDELDSSSCFPFVRQTPPASVPFPLAPCD